jgi:hypothetical protein
MLVFMGCYPRARLVWGLGQTSLGFPVKVVRLVQPTTELVWVVQ